MADYPKTLMELESQFSTEEACREYLFRLRWPSGYRCPRCGHGKAWPRADGLFECQGCGHKASTKAGTIFEGSRKPLVLWFRAVWWVTCQKNGASALGLQRILGLGSYETAWTWLHKLRRAMVRPGRDRLSGTIQIDETYIGGEKSGKRGRGAEGKTLVVIAAQEDGDGTGRIRLKQVADASGESLEAAVQETVATGAVVKTDGWVGYNGLKALSYQHKVIRKTAEVGKNLLPLCHREAALIKRWLDGTHQGAVSHEHLDYYLDEYTFRFNRRTSSYRGKLFYRLLQNAVSVSPTKYHDITKGVRGRKPQAHKM
jgi:transposase-like protein/DNA-directed RNA polymerase subunit RPC12/RpoP